MGHSRPALVLSTGVDVRDLTWSVRDTFRPQKPWLLSRIRRLTGRLFPLVHLLDSVAWRWCGIRSSKYLGNIDDRRSVAGTCAGFPLLLALRLPIYNARSSLVRLLPRLGIGCLCCQSSCPGSSLWTRRQRVPLRLPSCDLRGLVCDG